MSDPDVIEESGALVLYRQIAYHFFRQDLKLNELENVLGQQFAEMSDTAAVEFVDASIHALFHWCSTYEPPDTEEGNKVREVFAGIVEMTQHLCPDQKGENENDEA